MANECPNEFGLYQTQVVLRFPKHMYQENGGYYNEKDGCTVDLCMVDEIQFLWSKGVVTTGCCCGHGIAEGMINVVPASVQKMVELGYELAEVADGMCKETFVAKSKHRGVDRGGDVWQVWTQA